jgi:hypothetical protein
MRVFIVVALLAQSQSASPPRPAAAATVLEARLEADQSFIVDLYTDLDALLLGQSVAMPAAQRLAGMELVRAEGRAAEAAATERVSELLRRRLRVRFDGAAAELVVEYPERRVTVAGELTTLGSFVRLRSRVPAAAREVTFFASRSFRWIDLRVAIGDRRSRQMLEPGEESEAISLR